MSVTLRELVYPEQGEGLYEVTQFEEERMLTLRRKQPSPGGFREIQVRNFPSEAEQWRVFLGGHLDMVPQISGGHQRYLKQDPSVRIVPFQERSTCGLIFRTTSPRANDARVRRAISLALRRRAIAEMVNGDPASAAKAPEDLAQSRALLDGLGVNLDHPLRIVIWVLSETSEFLRAALIIEQQLALVNVDVDFQAMSATELQDRLDEADFDTTANADFDAIIFFGDFERSNWDFVQYFSRYTNPELEAAAGDEARWLSIMEEQVPVTPLYQVDQSVAVDSHVCGIHPVSPGRSMWLADVHPCRPGETE